MTTSSTPVSPAATDTPPEAHAGPTFTRQEKLFTMIGTLLGMLLAALDQTIVSTAGPQIQKDLRIDPSLYTWITTSYLVASTVMVPIYGKLSDLYGRRRILMFGIVSFLIGSLLCGLSGEPFLGNILGGGTGQLIAFRAIQGFGSAALFTTAFAVVSDLFAPAERGRYTGLFGAVFGISSVLGPLIGGFLTDHLSWHWVFYVNLPIGLIAIAFILTRMPALKHLYGRAEEKPRLDLLGALWLVVAVVPLLLALSLGKSTLTPGETGFLWGSWQILSMFAVAAVGTALFLLTERRAHDPLMSLDLFRNRVFSVGTVATFLLGMAFLGPIIFLPLFMVNVVGLSATNSGLTLTPLVLGLVAGNILSGQLVTRIGKYKGIMVASLVLLMAAFLVMGVTLHPDATQASVTWKMILIGLGLGPSIPLYTLAIQNASDPRLTGQVTSAVTFFRNLGQVVGVAILGTLFANTLSSELTTAQAQAQALLPAEARAQFGTIGQGEGSGASNFNVTTIKTTVSAKLDTQEQRITRALRDNDPASVKALLADPNTPEQLKTVLAAGGIDAQVKAGFDGVLAGITAAVRSGQPGALGALAANPQVPAALRAQLTQIPPQAITTTQGQDAVLARISAGLNAAQASAATQAKTKAVDAAVSAIESSRTSILHAIDVFGTGFKLALTDAVSVVFRVGLIAVVLGFLATLILPQVPLRRRAGPMPVAE
ncbi:EmrB/QacA subfamily drug resistance transporter [Deinococcus metalli]|uniref:EmrB/QacA subfamily drug resistance transporter n=1 Tax=Deinococcus metalli TaxID=1141878 RepID=A0A7W8KGC9_9DEIO|nr:MDR family MFS transporter [Deinococcus metalli]MBB5377627.1 EmrB/QacA subfamily drug resistance transporter [Deinococcus metalli]GHF52151.1 MFS transporter [Deinococcus metalli]